MQSQKLLLAASLMSLAASAPTGAHFIRPRNETPMDPAKALADLGQAFEAFKTANDERVKALENNKGVAELDAKISKLEETMNKAETALATHATKLAAGAGGEASTRVVDQDYTDSFNDFMRTSADGNVAPDVLNTLRRNDGPDGGYTAPVEWDRTIMEAQVELSPMRQICNVQQVSGAGFEKLVNKKGTAGGWVDEEDARPQTAAASFAKLGFGWGEVYAMPAATQTILEDSELDMEAWLAGEVAEVFELMEGSAFIAGNGLKKPRGLLTYGAGGLHETRNPLGSVGNVNSGDASAITSDAIIDLTYQPTSRYMQNARFIMNRKTMNVIRKLTDGDGNYLWQPTYVAGQPSSLCGYSLTEVADMPDLAADALPIAFGDFKAAYTIFDRRGISLLRDPYTAKPYVLFYTTKRVGGAVVDPKAFFTMKVAA